ncbi:MAG TPA: PKD domain-containing protein, partial [Kofleriaceae bacterium]|nr:PKD domain-containing protein [Kofleriaceae bacterium]
MTTPTRFAYTIVGAFVALAAIAGRAEAALRVIPVPWVATDPTIPHQAYNGHVTILKAVARGGNGTYKVEWDPEGDGVYNGGALTIASTNNRYDLSVQFTYPNQAVTTTFQAKVRVTSGAEVVVGTYPVRVFADVPADPNVANDRQLQVMRSVAVDNGLWYLHTKLLRSGAEEDPISGAQITGYLNLENQGFTGGNNINAATAAFLWNLGLNGHYAGWGPAYIGEMRDANDNAARFANDPYAEDASRMINHLLGQMTVVNVAGQDESNLTGFYPEVSKEPIFGTDDGIGLWIGYSPGEQTIYPMGHALASFSVMGMQGYVAQVGDANRVLGRRFEFIIQQMVDALVWAQNDGGTVGSWYYTPNANSDDLSTGLWGITGLWHADEFASKYGVIVPNIVKTRLVDYIRGNSRACNGGTGGQYTNGGGGCGFTVSAAQLLTLGWVGSNTFASNDGRVAFPSYTGTTRGQLRTLYDSSTTYIANVFATSQTGGQNGCWNSGFVNGGNFGNLAGQGNNYGMLHWQDAARAVNPPLVFFGANDWYRVFSRYFINNQLANGTWRWAFDNSICQNSDNAGGEGARDGWAMLVLSPDAIPPLAIGTASAVNAPEGTNINFNGSSSDPGTGNPVYTWAFGNGQSMPGQNVTYAFPDNGNFNVTLTSTSVGGTSVDTFPVTITNVAPTANAGPPKVVNEGSPTAFDVTVTDPGSADTFTYVWAWQDGTANGAV